MATEKLAKAYRFRDSTTDEAALLTSHVGFSQFVGVFSRSHEVSRAFRGKTALQARVASVLQRQARLIEQLAPSVDRANHPFNPEYPWASASAVVAPVDFGFDAYEWLREPRGTSFLKLVAMAFEVF
jgi:hypothetical protein